MAETPVWDTETAWRHLLALKDRAPDRDGRRALDGERGTLTLGPGGQWACQGASLSEPARELLDQLAPVAAAPGERYAIAQIAQSLDGRTATAGGRADRLTGDADQRRLHRVRALVDAVIVGAATALADNPRLTVRAVSGDPPVRVVLDRSRRLPDDHPLLCDEAAPTWRIIDRQDASSLRRVLAVPGMAPGDVLDTLAQRGLTRVLVEGGGRTVSRFLQAGCLDRLHLVIAPVLIGQGPSGLELPAIDGMEQALRPPWRQYQLGPDVLFDLTLGAGASPGDAPSRQ